MAGRVTEPVLACFDERIKELANALHLCDGNEPDDHMAELYASIKSTMTDQGPGMLQFSNKL